MATAATQVCRACLSLLRPSCLCCVFVQCVCQRHLIYISRELSLSPPVVTRVVRCSQEIGFYRSVTAHFFFFFFFLSCLSLFFFSSSCRFLSKQNNQKGLRCRALICDLTPSPSLSTFCYSLDRSYVCYFFSFLFSVVPLSRIKFLTFLIHRHFSFYFFSRVFLFFFYLLK